MGDNLGNLREARLPVSAFWARTFSSLQIRHYRWFWLGMLASFAGLQMEWMTRSWLAYQMSGSPLVLGMMSVAWGVPVLLFSVWGGVIADRVNKRNLLITTQTTIGLVALVIALLLATERIALWHLYASALLAGIIFSFNMPARQSFVPELVGESELSNAIALNSTGMNLMRIAAPALAGVVIGAFGVASAYYLVVVCYAIVVVTLLFIPTLTSKGKRPRGNSMAQAREGLHYVAAHPLIQALLGVMLVGVLLGFPYMALLPVFAADVLGVGAPGLGWLMTSGGVGAVAGSLFIASLGDYRRKGRLLLVLTLILGLSLVLFSASSLFVLSLGALVAAGIGTTGFMALNNTLLLSHTSHEFRGRVISIYMMSFGLQPLGVLPVSAAAEAWGAPLGLGVSGLALALVATALLLFHRALRQME